MKASVEIDLSLNIIVVSVYLYKKKCEGKEISQNGYLPDPLVFL